MTLLREVHERHDAAFEERGDRAFVANYGRPARSHDAVRNVVGVTEMSYDVLAVTGSDRIEYVDNAVSNTVPTAEGRGAYALLLTPQGRIRTDMYVYNAGERLLVFLPPGNGTPVAEDWSEKTFIQDVDIAVVSDEFGVFGVYGPEATEKVASVFTEGTPAEQLTFTRGSMGEAGVTVIRTDALTGETGYEVVCDASAAEDVFDTLENRGLNAAPFGLTAWRSLTLEAGTPLFEPELEDGVPNNLGLRNAVDFEKGCFVGQEVVSRVENRGQPTKRLVGLTLDAGFDTEIPLPDPGATVFDGDESLGEMTRAVHSPTREEPVAMALLARDVVEQFGANGALDVRIGGEERPATAVDLPLIEGSERSARTPAYHQ
ncbi:glycine cleavage system protein T [Halobacteriales archaeon QH_10_65_19]|nr:MAG: glycine cleavage system protein T [Halobacteriales archaeon QH_10_65_19]